MHEHKYPLPLGIWRSSTLKSCRTYNITSMQRLKSVVSKMGTANRESDKYSRSAIGI